MPSITVTTARTVRTPKTRGEVTKLVRDLPRILAGTLPDSYGLRRAFQGAIAFYLFTKIHEAFLIKSAGGTDELGDSWEDISPYTKAYKRKAGNDLPSNLQRRLKNKQTLGLLTPSQHRLWKMIFSKVYHHLLKRFGEATALKIAGGTAWNRLKEAGALTKIQALGNRKVPILQDTLALVHSLSPGKYSPESGYKKGDRKQIYLTLPKKVVIGTKISYANAVSKKRPIWPNDIDKWIDEAIAFARDILQERLQQILS